VVAIETRCRRRIQYSATVQRDAASRTWTLLTSAALESALLAVRSRRSYAGLRRESRIGLANAEADIGASVKRVLMIAYHFPPLAGSSGIQRTLRFVQHLPSLGWQPFVLTARPFAYEKTSDDLMGEVPADVVVRRAIALDTARHLQVGGRYVGWMARPDRWMSWKFDGLRQGRQLIRQFAPDAIWSTYPLPTAHVIASQLQHESQIPWIADFRDPMAQEGYPTDSCTRQSFLDIEAVTAARARYCVFTTPGAAAIYRDRYPAAADKMVVLENGFDEESFPADAMSGRPREDQPAAGRPVILLHSGIVYPSERDPSQLFEALGLLARQRKLTPSDLRIRFRAAVHESLLADLAKAHGVTEFIEIWPAIAYRDALREMLAVDVLLLMQASNCNAQIPAKVYEYLRAGKPILGLADPDGDTAGVLRRAGLPEVTRLDSAQEIADRLLEVVRQLRDGSLPIATPQIVAKASRRMRSIELVALLDRAAETRSRSTV
jgi:hypothetical protein